jgi:hypothetical protein
MFETIAEWLFVLSFVVPAAAMILGLLTALLRQDNQAPEVPIGGHVSSGV